MKKILFVIPYPLGEAPSQRFRFEQYFKILESSGFVWHAKPFFDKYDWSILFQSGRPVQKALAVMKGLIKRFVMIFLVHKYDFVFIHREAAPFGPPFFEWLIAKIFRKKIVYDFDDSIWMTDRGLESRFMTFIRNRSKVKVICKWSSKVSCGNRYLYDYARQFNTNVVLNPTTIDTESVHNPSLYNKKSFKSEVITIGWTGTHSTLKYLNEIEPILKKCSVTYPEVRFVVIADRKPDLDVHTVRFVEWNKKSEIEDLLNLDIGVMPLPDDKWSRGKCGFKVLQYMSLGIPSIASPVGVNTEIITNGVNGFLCTTPQEWYDTIELLVLDENLRTAIGAEGRKKMIENYSVSSNKEAFLSLFQ